MVNHKVMKKSYNAKSCCLMVYIWGMEDKIPNRANLFKALIISAKIVQQAIKRSQFEFMADTAHVEHDLSELQSILNINNITLGKDE